MSETVQTITYDGRDIEITKTNGRFGVSVDGAVIGTHYPGICTARREGLWYINEGETWADGR